MRATASAASRLVTVQSNRRPHATSNGGRLPQRERVNERLWQNGERTDAVSELQQVVDLVYARLNKWRLAPD
jgi:hypothetical protein